MAPILPDVSGAVRRGLRAPARATIVDGASAVPAPQVMRTAGLGGGGRGTGCPGTGVAVIESPRVAATFDTAEEAFRCEELDELLTAYYGDRDPSQTFAATDVLALRHGRAGR